MGYSVDVTIKSKRAHQKMVSFMRQNFRPYSSVFSESGFNPEQDWTKYLIPDSAYGRGKCRLGFNFRASGGIIVRDYAYSVLRWMALQEGRVRPLPKYTGSHAPVAYIVYDGKEAWPVLPRGVWGGRVPPAGEQHLTDDVGWQPPRKEWGHTFPAPLYRLMLGRPKPDFVRAGDAIRHELVRLNNLWNSL